MYKIIESTEVISARKSGAPILALESTIITHGMPYPQNLEMVQKVEDLARKRGVTLATLAVIDGIIHVGLDEKTLNDFAVRTNVAKLSRADLAHCVANGGTGATTVAATMIIAKLAHIDVFATGGIGGVHQGAEESFDISADLLELAKTDVIVVAAGAKAILDLPKTFEYLETQGVTVIGYDTDDLPAFYSRISGIPSPLRANHPHEIAASLRMRRDMHIEGGVLVANPIPKEAEIPSTEILPVINAALAKAKAENITSKNVTPFLLDAIYHATKGRSLEANIALVENNVKLGCDIALELLK